MAHLEAKGVQVYALNLLVLVRGSRDHSGLRGYWTVNNYRYTTQSQENKGSGVIVHRQTDSDCVIPPEISVRDIGRMPDVDFLSGDSGNQMVSAPHG